MKSLIFVSLVLSYFTVHAQLLPSQSSTQPNDRPTSTPSATPTTTTTTSADRPQSTSAGITPSSTVEGPTSRPLTDAPVSTTQPNSPTDTPSGTRGVVVTITSSGADIVVTLTGSAASSSTSAPAASNTSSSEPGLGTGSIVGLSVAGGIALLGVIAFFVWKFTRKRFSDFDDNEAIKWPDLNNHGTGNTDSHPLPVNNTGRSGFDTGSEFDLSVSNNHSTQDFNQSAAPDPYAVPPLPHLNPNQPYRDDPATSSTFYDPYRGPVPGTIELGVIPPSGAEWGSEAIPLTQIGTNAPAATVGAGRRSPAPQLAYQPDPSPYDPGRRSPGPYAAYDNYGGGGRMSPALQSPYRTGNNMSPAPGQTT